MVNHRILVVCLFCSSWILTQPSLIAYAQARRDHWQDATDIFGSGPTYGDQAAKALGSLQEMAEAKQGLNQEIRSARAEFWKQYPDGPQFAEVQNRYLRVLRAKDLHYLWMSAMGKRAVVFDVIGPKIDGGISPLAKEHFDSWAQSPTEAKWYERYAIRRDWAEVGSSRIKEITPEGYLYLLLRLFSEKHQLSAERVYKSWQIGYSRERLIRVATAIQQAKGIDYRRIFSDSHELDLYALVCCEGLNNILATSDSAGHLLASVALHNNSSSREEAEEFVRKLQAEYGAQEVENAAKAIRELPRRDYSSDFALLEAKMSGRADAWTEPIKKYLNMRLQFKIPGAIVDSVAKQMSWKVAASNIPEEIKQSWLSSDGQFQIWKIYKLRLQQFERSKYAQSNSPEIIKAAENLLDELVECNPLFKAALTNLWFEDPDAKEDFSLAAGQMKPLPSFEERFNAERYRGTFELRSEGLYRAYHVVQALFRNRDTNTMRDEGKTLWEMFPDKWANIYVIRAEFNRGAAGTRAIRHYWYREYPEGYQAVVAKLPTDHPIHDIAPPRTSSPERLEATAMSKEIERLVILEKRKLKNQSSTNTLVSTSENSPMVARVNSASDLVKNNSRPADSTQSGSAWSTFFIIIATLTIIAASISGVWYIVRTQRP